MRIRRLLLFIFCLALVSCDYWGDFFHSVKNGSSRQISVESKESNRAFEFRQAETFILDVQEERIVGGWSCFGPKSCYSSCEGPFLLEYIEVKDHRGRILYSQKPVDPTLWKCEGGHGECLCVFTVTDDLLNDLDDPDDDGITSDSLEEDEDSWPDTF